MGRPASPSTHEQDDSDQSEEDGRNPLSHSGIEQAPGSVSEEDGEGGD
jgi:hypothetical protein